MRRGSPSGSPGAPALGGRASLPGLSSQDPRHSIAFSFIEDFEVAERILEFARTGTLTPVGELLGSDIDLATNGNSEKAAGDKPIDHCAIESEIPEQVTQQEVHRFAVGEAGIQVEDVEAASVGHPRRLNQLPSQVDGHRGHVHTPVRQPPTRQPHRSPSTPTSDLQRLASRWKEMIDVGEQGEVEAAPGGPARCPLRGTCDPNAGDGPRSWLKDSASGFATRLCSFPYS